MIDTQEKAYWLGFLAADGYIYDNTVQLSLIPEDSGHLLTFKEHLKSEHQIIDYFYRRSCSRISITSGELVKGLAQFGVVNKKTFTVPWPAVLSDEVLRHYLRGYFDADGSFSYWTGKDGRERADFSVVGNRRFIEDCQEYIVRVVTIPRRTLAWPKRCRERGTDVRVLKYTSLEHISTLRGLLWYDSTVSLERKDELLTEYLGF
jgi:hypothetical protein